MKQWSHISTHPPLGIFLPNPAHHSPAVNGAGHRLPDQQPKTIISEQHAWDTYTADKSPATTDGANHCVMRQHKANTGAFLMMNPKAALQNNFDVTQVGHNEVAALLRKQKRLESASL